jgi:carbonic anhydrase
MRLDPSHCAEGDMADQKTLLPERLVEGYQTFLGGRFGDEQHRFRQLAKGQRPRIMIIGCCDSRVSPEVIFDMHPGEVFVVRNVANLAPPYQPSGDLHGTSAALEFAVMGLRVEHIVVMGHAGCGGVRAYAEHEADPYTRPLSPGDFIGAWMKLIEPAAREIGAPVEPFGEYVENLAHASVRRSLANLRTFPCVKTLEERGRLKLHGAYFGVADGKLEALDETTGEFLPIAAGEHAAALAAPRF